MNLTQQVVITLRVEGVHAWPNCPIKEVNYLKSTHRHMFHIKARKSVSHTDRDVEIIEFKHKLQNFLRDNYFSNGFMCHDFGTKSCEEIAKELLMKFNLDWCEVLEDGENGAAISINK